jgi:thiamine biosynthesis lipoprotein ApbE
VVTLRDAGLSTSSSRRTDAGGGAPRGHIVDPRTGALVSVARTAAVLSAGATEGDVLSTALVVEGQAGLRWTDRFPDTTAAVFERAGPDSSAGRTSWVQPAFAKHFRAALSRRS